MLLVSRVSFKFSLFSVTFFVSAIRIVLKQSLRSLSVIISILVFFLSLLPVVCGRRGHRITYNIKKLFYVIPAATA